MQQESPIDELRFIACLQDVAAWCWPGTVFSYFASAHPFFAVSHTSVFQQCCLQLALLTFEVLWFRPSSLSAQAGEKDETVAKPWQDNPRASEGPKFHRCCLQHSFSKKESQDSRLCLRLD